jgi:glycosyltransferase involved in cell wall biosynthesis
VCYYDLDEPLVQTQVLPYLRGLIADGFEIHLLTFERRRVPPAVRLAARSALAAEGIRWSSLRYHQRPSLPATVYDIAVGAAWTVVHCWRYRIRVVHARSHVAAAISLPARYLLRARLIFDMRGLLAEEYVDAGHWDARGVKFRLTKRMERVFFRAADAIVMLTRRIRDELLQSEPALSGRGGDIEVIPCCVDVRRFTHAASQRDEERASRGWTGRVVLAYAGKLGTWYLPREMAAFFAALRRVEPAAFFAVLTQGPGAGIDAALKEEGVSPGDYAISYVPPERLPRILGACDAGISFIMPSYSKRASSPTKIGEYLAAGLPVVTNAGIGDVDRLFADGVCGVLTATMDGAALAQAAGKLLELMARPSTGTECRRLAVRELGLAEVGTPRYTTLLRRLVERGGAAGKASPSGDPDTATR